MTHSWSDRWVAWLALAWCAGWSTDLVGAWRHAPYDRWGPVAFAGWGLALVQAGRGSTRPSGWWLLAAGLASFIGVAGELNVAQHVALALVAAALAGGGVRAIWLLVLAIGWMPVLGWAMRGLGPVAVNSVRGLMALVAVGAAWQWRPRK